MTSSLIRKFLFSAGILVLAAAVERLACLFHDTLAAHRLMLAKDKLFGLGVRDELWILIILELSIGVALLLLKSTSTRLYLLAWGMTNFLLVKWAIQSQGIQIEKSFIGSLSDPFHLAQGVFGQVVAAVPYYLLLGGYLALGWLWLTQIKRNRTARAEEQKGRDGFWKMSCPGCGGHVKFALLNEGQKISCPHCEKVLTLRREENLKMGCFFCSGHIEFPAHALGQKIACPHCRNDITLRE